MITELQGPRDSRDTSEHCGKIKDEQGALRSLDNHLMGGMAIVVRVSIKAMKVRTVAITESLHEADLASGGGRTRERRTHHAAIGSTPTVREPIDWVHHFFFGPQGRETHSYTRGHSLERIDVAVYRRLFASIVTGSMGILHHLST